MPLAFQSYKLQQPKNVNMKNETKAEKIIRTEIEKWSILKPTSMAKCIIKALMKANLISSNIMLADSLPLSDLPKLFEWIEEREINLDRTVWEEFVGHDTPNEYTTKELIEEWRKR